MIRVGFVLNFESNEWVGGVNYFRNLIGAICANHKRNLEPVIFTRCDSDDKFLSDFPAVPIVKDHVFDLNHPYARIRHTLKKLLHRDIVLEHLLKTYDISVVSHLGPFLFEPLGTRSHIPTIGWIADFQHKYLPDFFSKNELSSRDKDFQMTCAECTRVVFSSNAAKSDAEKFYPEYAKKYRVLHFAGAIMDLSGLPDFTLLKERYQIKEPYFIVPNQFWVHKNHMVILKALNVLKARGRPVTIIATGETSDYRQPDYFGVLQNKIRDDDLSENFVVTGIMPYKDLLQLMLHAVAIINPSLFEGWSTSVEEAKALNLKIILSDIPVHREQNPKNGIFFPPDNPERLADNLLSCLSDDRTDYGKDQLTRMSEKLNEQHRMFAEDYERIVQETLEHSS
jgi:glycosyltransferase involved in cell wall biosynthesis